MCPRKASLALAARHRVQTYQPQHLLQPGHTEATPALLQVVTGAARRWRPGPLMTQGELALVDRATSCGRSVQAAVPELRPGPTRLADASGSSGGLDQGEANGAGAQAADDLAAGDGLL